MKKIILALVLVGWLGLFSGLSPEIAVPDMTGVDLKQAALALHDTGLQRGTIGYTYASAQELIDQAVSQGYPGSTKVLSPQQDYVRIAQAGLVKVPHVEGHGDIGANTILSNAGLKHQIGKDFKKTEDNKLDWIVWKQWPAAGTMVPKGTVVTYEVYRYSGPVTVRPPIEPIVPNVTGMTYEQARQDLAKYGFGLSYKEILSGDPKLAAGIVREQSPKAGTKYNVQYPVSLTVERYKEMPKVKVPNIKNLTVAEAGKRLNDLKLHGHAKYKSTARKEEDGKVLDQDPAPSILLRQGETVTATVGKYSEQKIEVRFGLNSSKTAYILAACGGTQPYSVTLQPRGAWIVGVFTVKPLQDNPKEPGWKFFMITSRADDQVTILIKDAQGISHSYKADLKDLRYAYR